jgi:hypothetical protein
LVTYALHGHFPRTHALAATRLCAVLSNLSTVQDAPTATGATGEARKACTIAYHAIGLIKAQVPADVQVHAPFCEKVLEAAWRAHRHVQTTPDDVTGRLHILAAHTQQAAQLRPALCGKGGGVGGDDLVSLAGKLSGGADDEAEGAFILR